MPSPAHLVVAKSGGRFGWLLYGHDRVIALRTGFQTRAAAQRDGELFHTLLTETLNAQ